MQTDSGLPRPQAISEVEHRRIRKILMNVGRSFVLNWRCRFLRRHRMTASISILIPRKTRNFGAG